MPESFSRVQTVSLTQVPSPIPKQRNEDKNYAFPTFVGGIFIIGAGYSLTRFARSSRDEGFVSYVAFS